MKRPAPAPAGFEIIMSVAPPTKTPAEMRHDGTTENHDVIFKSLNVIFQNPYKTFSRPEKPYQTSRTFISKFRKNNKEDTLNNIQSIKSFYK